MTKEPWGGLLEESGHVSSLKSKPVESIQPIFSPTNYRTAHTIFNQLQQHHCTTSGKKHTQNYTSNKSSHTSCMVTIPNTAATVTSDHLHLLPENLSGTHLTIQRSRTFISLAFALSVTSILPPTCRICRSSSTTGIPFNTSHIIPMDAPFFSLPSNNPVEPLVTSH